MNNYVHLVNLSTAPATDGNEKDKGYVWYQDGKLHLDDEPAYIDEKEKIYWWFGNDEEKTDEITKWLDVNKIDWRNMSIEEKVLLKVVFG